MAKLKLSPPWVEFSNLVTLMFKEDPEVFVVFDEDTNTVYLYVENERKATSLAAILPEKKEFGNVTLNIEIVPANRLCTPKAVEAVDYKIAFENNPVVSSIEMIDVAGFSATYVIFKKIVCQFFDDNLASYYGLKSMLLEDIARQIFIQSPGVFFCTEQTDPLIKGLFSK